MLADLGHGDRPGGRATARASHGSSPAAQLQQERWGGFSFQPEAERAGRRSDTNTAGGFEGHDGVHNILLPQCAEGLNTCFLRAVPLHPRALTTTQHCDGGETTLAASISSQNP